MCLLWDRNNNGVWFSKRSGRFISMEGCFYPCHADHILMHHKYMACIHIRMYLHMYVYKYKYLVYNHMSKCINVLIIIGGGAAGN